ncbi:MAG: helix-turn-helix domain-containing protein [Fibromonadaceae bacterium]|jgi:transcriptional regulator with XRE-family HTH domain|nr:helix-turn-helix domain-containing protein [Fibromonadaceae bacterium]
MQKNNILGFVERKKISQKELAKSLNCTVSQVSCIISGKSKPSYGKIKKLLEMGATVEELFGMSYTGQGGQPVKFANLSDADAVAIVRQGLGVLVGNGVKA